MRWWWLPRWFDRPFLSALISLSVCNNFRTGKLVTGAGVPLRALPTAADEADLPVDAGEQTQDGQCGQDPSTSRKFLNPAIWPKRRILPD